MILKITRTIFFTSLCLSGGQAMAGSAAIPNTFVGGTKASAAEVNENFDSVKSAVDDNDTRISGNTRDIAANAANITGNTNAINALPTSMPDVFVDGVLVGKLLLFPGYSSSGLFIKLPTDYLAFFDGADGVLAGSPNALTSHEIYYISSNCDGQAFVNKDSVTPAVKFGLGQLYAVLGTSPDVLYVPKNSTIETITYNSKNTGSGCELQTLTTDAIRAYANNSDETGITNTELIGTVTISY